jgi:serine/threonine-protein kinase ATR
MRHGLAASLHWDARLEMLSTSLSSRKFVMAVRRSIFAIGGMRDLVATNWLHLSDLLQKSGKFEIAQIALRNAEASGLSKKQALLQECTILAKSGNVNRALSMLEPVEIDTAGLINVIDMTNTDPKLVREKHELANQILLATKWMVESRHNLGNTIEDRFKAVKELKGEWEDCLFEYGRFMEYRFHDAKSKEAEGVSTSKHSNSSKNLKFNTQDTPTSNEYLRDTIGLYAKALKAGTKYITQSLPRMLTLWFSSSMPDGCLDKNVRSDIQRIIEGIVPGNDKKMNGREGSEGASIPAHVWFTCMPQLVSRAQHRDQYTAHTIKRILVEIMATHPTQGIWHIGGMLNSHNEVRQNIGHGIIKHALPRLKDKSKGTMFEICKKLFKSFVDLAGADTGSSRRVTYNFPQAPEMAHILVPIKSALHVCIPEFSSENAEYFLSDQMYIHCFSNAVEVAVSKAKPKIVTLETSCGKKIKFLCKQEKNGDLRKDAHMMEINGVINRLLQEDPEGRKRCMRLRTFSIICLNEECGILEWVNNTSALRSLIKESHTYFPEAYPFKDAREFQNDIKENQDKYWFDIETMTTKYNELVLSKYRPYFHRWFLEHFRDPTDWLDARIAFTRSTAIWAAVGHIVGLGDRHTENILIDTTNGELVHVDFDCLFDKGLLLQRAEIVPFRLTPNIVDAMGVCGIEGAFRKTMEVGITLLRANKDTLLSILEPFLRDPTVAWSRSGRAQQFQTHLQSKQVLKAGSEHDNADAKEALMKISKRLDGVYNIYHPKAQDIKKEFYARYHCMPVRLGLGGQIDDSLPLSVQGQAQRLIEEATDEANLAQMFLGWTSWL